MLHKPEELHEEFPDLADKIHELKSSDAHFARLLEEYQELNHAVYLAESNVEPTSDEHMYEQRRQRMVLKDQLYAMLTAE